ncbi:MAG: signal peptide peptidase SppA, partial [Pseudomonadota bacterium]
EESAVDWLETKRNVTPDLPVRTWRPERDAPGFGLFARAAKALGADTSSLRDLLEREPIVQRLRLDGLVSVWHGPAR